MLTNLIIVLLWLAFLTFWIMINQHRKEQKMLAEFEADVFGDK